MRTNTCKEPEIRLCAPALVMEGTTHNIPACRMSVKIGRLANPSCEEQKGAAYQQKGASVAMPIPTRAVARESSLPTNNEN